MNGIKLRNECLLNRKKMMQYQKSLKFFRQLGFTLDNMCTYTIYGYLIMMQNVWAEQYVGGLCKI